MVVAAMVAVLIVCTLSTSVEQSDAASGETSKWDGSIDIDWYGDGTSDSFTITTAAGLAGLAQLVNGTGSQDPLTFEGKTITLEVNIDLNGHEWTPIGTGTRSDSGVTGDSHCFEGIFNGGGNTISGLSITKFTDVDFVLGLFGIVSGGTVEDLVLTGVNINVYDNESGEGSEVAGAVAGVVIDGGKISKCQVGTDTHDSSVNVKRGNGGIVGRLMISGTIIGCTNYASVTASGANVGGIVGAAYYTGENQTSETMVLENNKNYGVVRGTSVVGGIVGLSAATLRSCDNFASVQGNGYAIGGIVGEQQNYGSLTYCDNSGEVSNTNTNAGDESSTNPNGTGMGTGGIIGWIRYSGDESGYQTKAMISIMECKNSTPVESSASHVGGIVGAAYHSVNIDSCENTGTISGDSFIAGILGGMQSLDSNHPGDICILMITDCVNSGAVIHSTDECVGSIVGHYTSEDYYGKITDGSDIVKTECHVVGGSYWTILNNSDTANQGIDTGLEDIESVATITKGGVEYGYHSLDDAVNAVTDGDTIHLVANFIQDVPVTISSKVTIDLAGHTVTSGLNEGILITVANGGDLTIKDSVGEGTISGSGTTHLIQSIRGSVLTIDSGKFEFHSTNGVYYMVDIQGTGTINGGTFNVGKDFTEAGYAIRVYGGGDLTINNMTINSKVSGLLVRSTSGQNDQTTAIINNGTINAAFYGIAVFGDGYNTPDDNEQAVLTIKDITIEMESSSQTDSESVCIGTNASGGLYGGHTITIEGGMFRGNTGAYFPSYGIYKIEGGTFDNAMYGIRIAAGVLSISEDAVIDVDVEYEDEDLVSESKPTGVMGPITIGKVGAGYVGDVEVNISSGIVSNPSGNAITVYDNNMSLPALSSFDIQVNLTGGIIIGDVMYMSDGVSSDSTKLAFTLNGGSVDGDVILGDNMSSTMSFSSGYVGSVIGVSVTPTGEVKFPDGRSGIYFTGFTLPGQPEEIPGYTFLGYSLTAGSQIAQYDPEEFVTATGVVMVYEVWEHNVPQVTVTVTFPSVTDLPQTEIHIDSGSLINVTDINVPEAYSVVGFIHNGTDFTGPVTSDITVQAVLELEGTKAEYESEDYSGYSTIEVIASNDLDGVTFVYYLYDVDSSDDGFYAYNLTGLFTVTSDGTYAVAVRAILSDGVSSVEGVVPIFNIKIDVQDSSVPGQIFDLNYDGDNYAGAVDAGKTSVSVISGGNYQNVDIDLSFSDANGMKVADVSIVNGNVQDTAVTVSVQAILQSQTQKYVSDNENSEYAVGVDVSVDNITEYDWIVLRVPLKAPDNQYVSSVVVYFIDESNNRILDSDIRTQIDGDELLIYTNHNTPYIAVPIQFSTVPVYEDSPIEDSDNVHPPILDDGDDYVPIPPVVYDDSGDDDTVKIVACAAAAVVAALIAAYLIIDRKY